MSITPQDVHGLIDPSPEQPQLRQQEIGRIVRVLNAHRHPTTTTTTIDGFRAAGPPAPAGHSTPTTLADTNNSLTLLMGKNRPENLQSLQPNVDPYAEAVTTTIAAHNPGARRRQH